jgi:hypothetical protein
MNIDDVALEYLREAEICFGPMVSDWSFSGVQFNDATPHLVYYPETASVGISLSKRAETDELQFHFQLAHEVCHMLYPCMNVDTFHLEKPTVLNEGISTYFSIIAVSKFGAAEEVIDNLKQYNKNYFDALYLVAELVSINSQSIKNLRQIEPKLNKLLPIHFFDAGINATSTLIEELLHEFI